MRFQHLFKALRLGLDSDFFACQGVCQAEAMGMQHETWCSGVAVKGVADDGMPVMGEMHADLVGAPRFQATLDQTSLREKLETVNDSSSALPVLLVNHTFTPVVPIAPNLIAKNYMFSCQPAVNQGPILAPDFLFLKETVEDGQDERILGKKNSSTGFHVKAMNDIAGLSHIGRHMIKQGKLVWFIAVGLHALGFIDNDDVLVLVERFNEICLPKRNSLRWIIVIIESQLDEVVLFNQTLPVDSSAIDQNMLLNAQKMSNLTRNEQVFLQKLLDGAAAVLVV